MIKFTVELTDIMGNPYTREDVQAMADAILSSNDDLGMYALEIHDFLVEASLLLPYAEDIKS